MNARRETGKCLKVSLWISFVTLALPCVAQSIVDRGNPSEDDVRNQIRRFSLALVETAREELAPIAHTEPVSQEPGWSGGVIKLGAERAAVQATPILARSYRPFHFYGNTVRRRHYRGYTLPRPQDLWQGTTSLIRPRR